jgi:formate hydrogenlyase subunit 6/NADH:ubiquinone oxidoreductase subunit I
LESDTVEHSPLVLDRAGFDRLLDVLRADGFRLIGPTIRDGTIVYGDVTGSADLPVGWTDQQEAGRFRIAKRPDAALFGYVPGADSWKSFLHPPRRRVWRAERTSDGLRLVPETAPTERLAFIGARSCELHAVAIQDRILSGDGAADPDYAARRRGIFVVAVNCGQAGGTCFCSSMHTGPRVAHGFDLALTELLEPDAHRFVVEIGTERGAGMMARIPHAQALAEDLTTVDRIIEQTAARMGRTMESRGVKDLLYRNLEHRRWDEVAARCLSCANCTMVCPTCFCSTVEDVTDLTGDHAERWQRWDSCFTQDFSYVHGGSVRSSTKARYRQWMTHKLATWFDQFGMSGCVGCGRCITWCPVGIDITEEARAIRDGDRLAPAVAEEEQRHGEP